MLVNINVDSTIIPDRSLFCDVNLVICIEISHNCQVRHMPSLYYDGRSQTSTSTI
jgi:hypothetical protein